MKKNNTAKVIEGFNEKRARAIADGESRKLAIHALLPDVFEIDRELSKTSVNILSIITSGTDVDEKMSELKAQNTALRQKRAHILKDAGYPEDYTDVHFECDKCYDTGFVGVNMCDCLRKAVSLAAFEDSGIGALVKSQSFETFSLDFYSGNDLKLMSANFETLRSFAVDFKHQSGKNFILMGNTGLGKTHLSTSVAKTVIEGGYKVMYETTQAVMSDFESQRFRGTVTEEELDRYFECDLLIIDDLGCELSNQFTISCIYNLINSRINNNRSTIINTNLSQSELREKYADRITSRIFGEYRPLIFAGRDIRAQKLNK